MIPLSHMHDPADLLCQLNPFLPVEISFAPIKMGLISVLYF